MNNVAHPIAARAVRMGKTFTAWRLDKDGRESARIDLGASNLKDAISTATPHTMPVALARGGFDPFVILETDETARDGKARHVLHFFTVKAKRDWRSTGPGGVVQQVALPYAVPCGSLPVNAFEPRRPFSLVAGDCPITGRQPGECVLIEAQQ